MIDRTPPLPITRQASALGLVKEALINPGGIYSEVLTFMGLDNGE